MSSCSQSTQPQGTVQDDMQNYCKEYIKLHAAAQKGFRESLAEALMMLQGLMVHPGWNSVFPCEAGYLGLQQALDKASWPIGNFAVLDSSLPAGPLENCIILTCDAAGAHGASRLEQRVSLRGRLPGVTKSPGGGQNGYGGCG